MIRAFASEWLKLRRLTRVLGGTCTMIGFTALTVVLMVNQLGSTHPAGGDLTTAQLSAAGGFAQILAGCATFLGVIALAVCAVSVGTDYASGTLRNLLVRQPHRLRFLGGKAMAMGSFVVLSAALASCAALVTAMVLASSHEFTTSAWFTSAGWRSLLSATGNTLLSTVAWGVVGATIALVFRSSTAAIAGGLAYLLVVENLVSAEWSPGKQWLPGQVLSALAHGGNASVTYGAALGLAALYVGAAAAGASMVFQRRDVAA